MLKKIGILGGTFDPVHIGHLRTALDVIEQLKLDQVRLIPCGIPPHKIQLIATAEQRITMMRLAIRDEQYFIVDDRELHREGPSYTVDTLVSLRYEFVKNPLYLFLGTDAFVSINTWYNWRRLLDFTHIVVMQRPGESLTMSDELTDWYKDHLAARESRYCISGNIWPVNVTQIAISATKIRKKIARGLNLRFFMPDAVISFIKILGLY
ncbi:MAG: nicotinate-nucleotide adenylyltransferase [Piscirickettsiaceae bacterium]|nr:nicotinate-nucleotide adenylyltransferase [Piscirickettsiaceae bacterium]